MLHHLHHTGYYVNMIYILCFNSMWLTLLWRVRMARKDQRENKAPQYVIFCIINISSSSSSSYFCYQLHCHNNISTTVINTRSIKCIWCIGSFLLIVVSCCPSGREGHVWTTGIQRTGCKNFNDSFLSSTSPTQSSPIKLSFGHNWHIVQQWLTSLLIHFVWAWCKSLSRTILSLLVEDTVDVLLFFILF